MDGRKDTAVEALLEHLIEHGPSDIATVFGRAFELAMQIERERFLRAGPYERTAARQGYANGYKPKRIDTPAGTVRRGTRPRAPHDQRTKWAYIFGAICPKKGKGAGLVMPWCDTHAMAAHLAEISQAVDPGAHAVLMLDQAGWHMSAKLAVPDNITLLALPPRSPELNPVENVWQFLRENWLSNRVFKSYEDIVALCCDAWNNLIDRLWKIMSIGIRKWAHG